MKPDLWEHRLRKFGREMLRRIFRPQTEEVRRGWRKLHSEEHLTLYSSLYIIREIKSERMRLVGNLARMGALRISVGKPEGKELLGRTKCRWEDNIKMGFEYMYWIHVTMVMAQCLGVTSIVMSLNIP
jgi:hypothetical protein